MRSVWASEFSRVRHSGFLTLTMNGDGIEIVSRRRQARNLLATPERMSKSWAMGCRKRSDRRRCPGLGRDLDLRWSAVVDGEGI